MARAEEAKLDPWSSRKTGAGKIGSLRGQHGLVILHKNIDVLTYNSIMN